MFLGHVETYVDPGTNQTFDYGVYILSNISVVTDFFAHFNTSLVPFVTTPPSQQAFADFKTGAAVNITSNTTELVAALARYVEQLQKYPNFTSSEGWEQLPSPIPDDLLLPFGE